MQEKGRSDDLGKWWSGVWLNIVLGVVGVGCTLFKPYTIVLIYVRASKSCITVEIPTIIAGVKLQNLTKKCPRKQKVPLILIMGTFFKNVWGYFSENKIPFLPFFAYAIPIPITLHYIITPSPISSPIHPHTLPITLHPYSASPTLSTSDFHILAHFQTLLINIHNIIYIIHTQPTTPEKTKKEKLRFWLAVRQTKSQANN